MHTPTVLSGKETNKQTKNGLQGAPKLRHKL